MMRHVHIVDEDTDDRDALRGSLQARPNLIVRCFRSGDAFMEQEAEIDDGVLLLGIDATGAGALDVLDAIARGSGRHAAVVLSARRDVALAVDAMKAGALDFVEKPCEPARLLGVLEQAFATLDRASAASRRVRAARAKIAGLSPREGDVLRGLIEGRPNKAIASELDLSPRTVEIHRAKVMEKLDVRSLSEALRIAFTAGMFAGD